MGDSEISRPIRIFFIVVIIIGVLLLCSCSTFRTIEARIPVIVERPNVHYDSPELPIKKLNKESKPPEVMKAYVKSVIILKRDNEKLRTILESQN